MVTAGPGRAGPVPPNPVELLSSNKMLDFISLAQEKFDYVFIDGPPVVGLADALVLANMARASLVVIEVDKTRARALTASIKRLSSASSVAYPARSGMSAVVADTITPITTATEPQTSRPIYPSDRYPENRFDLRLLYPLHVNILVSEGGLSCPRARRGEEE